MIAYLTLNSINALKIDIRFKILNLVLYLNRTLN